MKTVYMAKLIEKPKNPKRIALQMICANSKDEATNICTLKAKYEITELSTMNINADVSILYETCNF